MAGAGIDTRSRFDGSGSRVGLQLSGPAGRETLYRGREGRLYVEYGVLDALTGYGSFLYKDVRLEQPSVVYRTRGGGDAALGVRWRLVPGRVPLSVAAEANVPTGYESADNPALGAGQVDATVRALAGVSGGWWYGTADAGYTHRAGRYRDEVVLTAEVGGRAASRYGGRVVLRGVRSLGSTEAMQGTVFDPSLASPRSLVLDTVASVAISRAVSIEAGVSQARTGRNTLAGNTLELGLAWSADVP